LLQQEYQLTTSFLRSSAAVNSSTALSLWPTHRTSARCFLSERKSGR